MTILDNVEVFNCSQYDTYKAALRWEQATYRYSEVRRSSVHHGLGWGAYIVQSENVLFDNNVIFDFVNFGVNIAKSANVTFNYNWVVNVHRRNWEAELWHYDKMAGLSVCAFVANDPCTDVFITNNIVMGADLIGILAPGHDCDDNNDKTFLYNTAHSTRGQGLVVFPLSTKESHAECLESYSNVAYKNQEGGLFTYFATARIQFSNFTLIDNGRSLVP
mmetsp:Transcript_34116/g.25175  ORF Transcript_34116/g.25175 Transcript_34116/m.25175 type:complete len:219 (-) Transcript_34116:2085-2741(-)